MNVARPSLKIPSRRMMKLSSFLSYSTSALRPPPSSRCALLTIPAWSALRSTPPTPSRLRPCSGERDAMSTLSYELSMKCNVTLALESARDEKRCAGSTRCQKFRESAAMICDSALSGKAFSYYQSFILVLSS